VKKGVLLFAAPVTTQTPFGVFAGIGSVGKDQFVGSKGFGFVPPRSLLSFNVRLTRTMAGLTRHHGLYFVLKPRMRGLVEFRDLRLMTCTASVVADDVARRTADCG
jgi:hypothetical protein